MSNIVVIQGNPNTESLNAALAQTYVDAARSAGHEVRLLSLPALAFDPVLHSGFAGAQPLEPDIVAAQDCIAWANHLVFVYPVWWGAPPALLKGFVDRVLLPGFAFKYRPNSPMWDRLLVGRTGRLVVTSDSPSFWLKWVMGNSAVKLMKKSVLEFCGVSPVRVTLFPSVRKSTPEQRRRWLDEVGNLGAAGR